MVKTQSTLAFELRGYTGQSLPRFAHEQNRSDLQEGKELETEPRNPESLVGVLKGISVTSIPPHILSLLMHPVLPRSLTRGDIPGFSEGGQWRQEGGEVP